MRAIPAGYARYAITAIICGYVIVSASAQSVEQAIAAALDNSPSIDRAEAQKRAAREDVRQARASYLPEVSFDASASTSQRDARLRGSSDFSENSEPVSASLRAQQSLYTHGLRPIAQRRAITGVRARGHELAATRNAIALQVVEAMVRLHLARSTKDSELRLHELITSQLTAEQERLRLQAGTRTDVAQAEARLASADASLARASGDIAQAERHVTVLTGLEVAEFLPPLHEPPLPLSLEDALQLAWDSAPEIALARSNYDVSRLGVAAASRRYGPQVNLSVEASTARRPSPAIERDDDVRATLSLSVPLFNGGRGSSERRQAYAQKTSASADRRQAEQDIELRVTEAWFSVQSARLELSALQTRLQAADEALEGVRRGRGAGLWSVTDLLDAMEQKISAERAIAETHANLTLAAYQLSVTCGLYDLPR